MEETELKLHPCYHCGGDMEIRKVSQDGGMDGMYLDWKLTCKKCGLTMTYPADDFYARKYKTFEEVIDDWNRNKKKEKNIEADVLNKIRTEIMDTGAYEQETMGQTEFLKGINYCLGIIDKYNVESEEV